MLISVVNCESGVRDDDLLDAIRAVNRQIDRDFRPYWNLFGELRLGGGRVAEKSGLGCKMFMVMRSSSPSPIRASRPKSIPGRLDITSSKPTASPPLTSML